MIKPTLHYEQALWQQGYQRIAGLDEVGRGALCACVVAAAVVLEPNTTGLEDVRDSKSLSARQRTNLALIIKQKALAIGIGAASPPEIDRINILRASGLAMQRALRQIGHYDYLLVDGNQIMPELGTQRQNAIVKGDAHVLSIACASVIAKVCRDQLLSRLAKRYPFYGWERNAGYPTPEHKAAIVKYGPTPHHRKTFGGVKSVLNNS